MTFVVSVVFATARTLNVAASEGGVHKAMTEPFISRGFRGRGRHGATAARLPPGQYETPDFPVLSAGPTPRTPVATWDFLLRGADGPAARWTWDEFQALPHETVNTDIHCVTKWSKLDTIWEGVSLDTLLAEAAARGVKSAPYVLAVSDGGYTTNLLVPHLYFWKSAKWVRQLRFMEHDTAGFWESFGYHNYGDPWREQRYSGDA